MRILIVDDERSLADGLKKLLEKKGYAVDAVYGGTAGLDYALSDIYDLVILDIMLPEMDGLTLLRRMRAAGIETPVLLLTARGDARDCVEGLDCGADDYLSKPFETDVLLARIRALTRRRDRPLQAADPAFGDLVLCRERMELCRGDKSVRLGAKEFQIMECLMEGKGRAVSRQFLCEKVWGMLSEAEYNNVEVYVTFLRRRLRALESTTQIRFLRGAGYYLEAAV